MVGGDRDRTGVEADGDHVRTALQLNRHPGEGTDRSLSVRYDY